MENFRHFTEMSGDEFNTIFATEEDLLTDVLTFTFLHEFTARVHRNGHTEFFEGLHREHRNGIYYVKTFKSSIKIQTRIMWRPHAYFYLDNGWRLNANFEADHRCAASQDVVIFTVTLEDMLISLVSE